MDKRSDNPSLSISEEDRKSFAQSAGISIHELNDLESSQPKRQRRPRKDPNYGDYMPRSPKVTTDTKPDPRSPATTVSRQENAPQTPPTPKKQTRTVSPSTPKSLKTSQVKLPKDLAIPKSVDEFDQNYITFSSKLFKNDLKAVSFIDKYKKQLFELFKKVVDQGGIVKVISQGYKNIVLQPFVEPFHADSSHEIFEIYKKYLIHFEYQILQNYTFKQYHNAVPLFQEAVFVDESDLRAFLDKTPLDPKYFEYDIMVFRNGQNAINIDSNTIHLDRVAEHYKDYNIDIRIQKGMDYGFKPRTMRNEPYQMKISHYRIYQKLCHEYAQSQIKIDANFIERLKEVKDLDVNGTSFKERVNSEEIFFGVNFDPDGTFLIY